MRYFSFFAQAGIVLYALLTLLVPAANAHQPLKREQTNYVIIGAFAIENNAMHFADQASELNLPARFEINRKRNLYYVYVLQSDDLAEAVHEATRVRKDTRFSDAWVYTGILGNTVLHEEVAKADGSSVSESPIQSIAQGDQSQASPDPSHLGQMKVGSVQSEQKVKEKLGNTEGETKSKRFFFKLYRATNNEIVQGEVDVIDPERSRKLGSYQGNTTVIVPSVENRSTDIILQCNVFGYRKLQRSINANSPAGDDIIKEGDDTVIPFELVRLQKGDISVMYNVFFYKDAAVMRPESKYEADNLLNMLKENPKYRIKIHGHTNGRAPGRIISMGEQGNFFTLTNTKDGYGSAKLLSEERAKIISSYLAANGIAPDRMLIKAWGGKRPLHDKHHARASENVRVEIEILED